jgi:hypothetical protein
MKNLIKALCAIALIALPMVSLAHPGHGHDNPLSPGHYLGTPEHAIPITLTIVVAVVFVVWKIRSVRNNYKK